MIVTWSSTDKSVNYEIEIKQECLMTFNQYGKCWNKRWVKQTEAVIKKNGFIVATHRVTKHNNDPDNYLYAVTAALKPAMKKGVYKDCRKPLWDLVFAEIKKQ